MNVTLAYVFANKGAQEVVDDWIVLYVDRRGESLATFGLKVLGTERWRLKSPVSLSVLMDQSDWIASLVVKEEKELGKCRYSLSSICMGIDLTTAK